jgi:hypothetical protein
MSKKQSIAVFGNRLGVPGEFVAAPVLGHKAVGFVHVAVVIFQTPQAPVYLVQFARRMLMRRPVSPRALDHHS